MRTGARGLLLFVRDIPYACPNYGGHPAEPVISPVAGVSTVMRAQFSAESGASESFHEH
jgi:hypothetical protein